MAKVMSKEVKAMFVNAETLGELKNAYLTATLKYKTAKIREIANEMYIEKFDAVKDIQRSKKGNLYEKASAETCSFFLNACQYLRECEGLDCYVDGSWVWITGDTKANKEALKNAGAWYAKNKKCWFIKPQF